MTISIFPVEPNQIDAVSAFVRRERHRLFPMLRDKPVPHDLLHFHETYLASNKAAFFAAYKEGNVVGTIGFVPYDGRFPELEPFIGQKTATEIVKCYVDPDCRREGIGTALFQTAAAQAAAAGYETLYLHTHPFLPGGIPFWQRLGFTGRCSSLDPVWRTLHMDKPAAAPVLVNEPVSGGHQADAGASRPHRLPVTR